MCASTLRAFAWCFLGNYHFSALIAVISRNPVSPPELSGNTPVTDIVCPVKVGLFHTLRKQCDLIVFDCIDCRLDQFIHFYEPLLLDHRLYGRMTTVMCSDIMGMRYNLYQKSLLL